MKKKKNNFEWVGEHFVQLFFHALSTFPFKKGPEKYIQPYLLLLLFGFDINVGFLYCYFNLSFLIVFIQVSISF